MDRVKSSMQQVPNPIPKALIRRTGGANSLELEKENFERGQAVSINKAINTQEVAVKEKHARNILFVEPGGAHTFWAAVNRLPLSSNAVLCWKFCHVFHKLLRDGHPNVIKDSMRNKADLSDMSRMWGHLSEGYGKLCSIYLKLLITKMEFHVKNPRFPGNLQMSNRQLDEAGENDCRLAPLIQVILDSSHLYDYTVKLLFKLHSCELKSLFYRSSNLQYFKRLIQIPQLPENPPNFLRASALSEHISPVVVIPAESSSPETEHMVDLVTEDLVDTDIPVQPAAVVEPRFDDLFGTSAATDPFNFNSQNGMRKDDKMQALGESEFLRVELDDLRRVKEDTEKEQRSLTEIERKAVANEQRYTKLKEKYTELVQSHADLLRKNAEVTRQVTEARAAQDEVDSVRREMQEKVKAAQEATESREQEQVEQLQELQRELISSRAALDTLKSTMASSQQSSEELSSQLSTVESEKVELAESLSKKEEELAGLGEELERVQSSLAGERENGVKTAEALQNQLNEKESREQALESQLVAARWSTLQGAVEEAERIVQDSLAQLDDPAHISCTSSADYLASRCQASLDCMDRLHSARDGYLADNTGLSELVRAITHLAHLVGDTIVQGSATSHMVPVEQADALSDSVKACGAEALTLLGQMKEQESLATADSATLRAALDGILATAEKLRPRGLELQQGELGDLVEQEMAATSAAVESAAARIEDMLNKILASCTDLMQAIKVLVLSSKDLQRDINSRWTEGLISASKAVGWGATVMVDAADLVVQGKGKYEELMVCSHEIAASTAQLVAASKVKADKDNANLGRLKLASKGVTQATAGVSVLELETKLQKERERLGELRKKHYELAGVAEGWGEEDEAASNWTVMRRESEGGWIDYLPGPSPSTVEE
ncbi:unnamed protein product [Coregonus sp. 'balchen']|nr:unnamed protein product [Coregonus sp. 'balchen']